ncbi:hypothetical protein SAV14893_083690 [Streptomyces avermitilis]|uniref:Uncharacterized protein n=1 Tax=Streptomyces avermitilis TaxID=33903 RepID=A0A4D4MF81_STRAX|nr:hypothetical protein SAVMC3_01270 [Streptomyces avermitilis]GDY68976.1 hypothetical protein SAV14893_083690 [Streptomyces avermitilis]GDY70641.1 hypothetical protein SAV31267_001260 [Streptomyces avermitilis]GDY80399.1 hypothetical protein SAV31267_098840 [Streptomyces avermitilis]
MGAVPWAGVHVICGAGPLAYVLVCRCSTALLGRLDTQSGRATPWKALFFTTISYPPLSPAPIPSAVDPHTVERAWSMAASGTGVARAASMRVTRLSGRSRNRISAAP